MYEVLQILSFSTFCYIFVFHLLTLLHFQTVWWNVDLRLRIRIEIILRLLFWLTFCRLKSNSNFQAKSVMPREGLSQKLNPVAVLISLLGSCAFLGAFPVVWFLSAWIAWKILFIHVLSAMQLLENTKHEIWKNAKEKMPGQFVIHLIVTFWIWKNKIYLYI